MKEERPPVDFVWLITGIVMGAFLVFYCGIVKGADLDPKAKAAVEAGRALFYDTRCSIDNSTSCGSCHDPKYGGTDGRALALGRVNGFVQGRQLTGGDGIIGDKRSSPIINEALEGVYRSDAKFWDKRALNAIDQAIQPMSNPKEMGQQTAEQVAARLNQIAGYRSLMQAAFGSPEVTPERMRAAIVAFEKVEWTATVTPLSKYLAGDKDALDAKQARGAEVFRKNCNNCHPSPLFTDGLAANDGYGYRFDPEDPGLAKTTGNQSDLRKYKKPGLIDLYKRGHYGHNGAFDSIKDYLKQYQARGGFRLQPNGPVYADPLIDKRVNAIKLTDDDVADLEAVLVYGTVPYTPVTAKPPKEFPR